MDIREALQELGDKIKRAILARMESDLGFNYRAGKNTLVDSDLYHSVNVDAVSDDTLVFSILQHWEYVSIGWRHTGRFPNTAHWFIMNLLDWIRRKGIRSYDGMTQNELAWAIYKSINKRGIEARPFIIYDPQERPDVILPFLDKFVERFMDGVFEEITKELDKRL